MAAYILVSFGLKARKMLPYRRGEVDILMYFLESLGNLEVARR